MYLSATLELYLNLILNNCSVVSVNPSLSLSIIGYTAKLVGKATDEKTLFSLPEVIQDSGSNFLREVISRNTAILGNYLLQLWQQNGGELVINNLSPIAEIMGNSNYEIKIYLLYLLYFLR